MLNESGLVTLGSWVTVKDGELQEAWRVVDPAEADAARRLISADCPLGKALLGHRAGDQVRVDSPGGGGPSPSSRLSEPGQTPGEGDILATLTMLAEFSRVYWLMLQDAGPVIERLSQDYSPAASLVTTLATAIARPPYVGTPRHVEQLARDILADLPDA